MSPDTVLPGKGMEPQGLNRYAYVFNNPIKYLDPTGHAPNDVRLDNINDWLQAMGPEAVASYNHYYWGWYNWKYQKIYPNQDYWEQQHANYLNSWVSGMGPDGVLQPKPPKQKKGPAAWNTTPPSKQTLDKIWDKVVDQAKEALQSWFIREGLKDLILLICPELAPVFIFFDAINSWFKEQVDDLTKFVKTLFHIPGAPTRRFVAI